MPTLAQMKSLRDRLAADEITELQARNELQTLLGKNPHTAESTKADVLVFFDDVITRGTEVEILRSIRARLAADEITVREARWEWHQRPSPASWASQNPLVFLRRWLAVEMALTEKSTQEDIEDHARLTKICDRLEAGELTGAEATFEFDYDHENETKESQLAYLDRKLGELPKKYCDPAA